MPIEIFELAVRAKVGEQPCGTENANGATKPRQKSRGDGSTAEAKKSVDAILDVLKRKNER